MDMNDGKFLSANVEENTINVEIAENDLKDNDVYFTWYSKRYSINIVEMWFTKVEIEDKNWYNTICLM